MNRPSGTIEKKTLILILVSGALLRLIFYKFLGPLYWHSANYYEQGDSSSWIRCVYYLVNNFHYTCDPAMANGEFFRPPGYSFFLLPFYLVTGNDAQATYKLVAVIQTLLDIVSIWFVWQIAKRLFTTLRPVIISAALYACYPFIIVWNPIAYAESTSIFFMLGSFYFLLNTNLKGNYALSGLMMAASVLTRLQTMFIIPAMFIGFIIAHKQKVISFRNALTFFMSFSLLYGLWPARNYFLHDRIVFGQDVRRGGSQGDDLIAFYNYILTVNTDIYPQFDQIVYGKKVEWPPVSYSQQGEAAKLDSLVRICRECGTGFTKFMYDYKLIPEWSEKDNHCDSAIIAGFDLLTARQREVNPLNSYLIVPLNNLQKAFFKTDKYKSGSALLSVAYSVLFGYRSLLIILGLAGVVLMLRKKQSAWMAVLIIIFFIGWYLYLSFVYRNMEIRYLLSCDIMLLFPAAFLIASWTEKFSKPEISSN